MGLEDFDRFPLRFGPSPCTRSTLTALGGAALWAKR